MLEFYSEKERTARIQHKCSLCCGEIHSGEQYMYCSGKYDGDFFYRKYHMECSKVIYEYCEYTGENEYSTDDVMEWWQDSKCKTCKKRYITDCDSDCDWYEQRACGNNCEERTRLGKCRADETCWIMDRLCWCTMFELEE